MGCLTPTDWLSSKPTKMSVKTMAKGAVLQYWLAVLRTKSSCLSSLRYLKTEYLGLTKCHPIFTTCGHYTGQDVVRQVQGGGPDWTLGTMEQGGSLFPTSMLGFRTQPPWDIGVPPATLSISVRDQS